MIASTSMADIEPLGLIGANVKGVDLNRLDPQQIFTIRQALQDHLVLFFEGQALDAAALHAVASQFGTPTIYPYVDGVPGFPEVVEVIKRRDETTNFGGVWHSDTAYLPAPAMGAILHAKQLPAHGGDTIFTNMYAVYESLSPGLKSMLESLKGVNDADNEAIAATRPGGKKKGLVAEHPVIRTHPDSGRKLLYVNRAHTTRFAGMTVDESRPTLQYLFDLIEQPEFSYRFSWQPGNVAFWDNRACQHFPVNDYNGMERRMLRVSLAGDVPF